MDKICPKRRQQCKVIMHVVDKGRAGLNNTHKKHNIYRCITSRVDNLSLDHCDAWQLRDTSCHVVQSHNGGGPRYIKSLSPVSVIGVIHTLHSPNTNQQRRFCSLLQTSDSPLLTLHSPVCQYPPRYLELFTQIRNSFLQKSYLHSEIVLFLRATILSSLMKEDK